MIIRNTEGYDKMYNVEYYLGNGKIATFSNILVNIGDGYYYFSSKKYGLDVIEQKAIRTMVCIEKARCSNVCKSGNFTISDIICKENPAKYVHTPKLSG
jgi:hypothetical protein